MLKEEGNAGSKASDGTTTEGNGALISFPNLGLLRQSPANEVSEK